MPAIVRTEFALALNQVATERGIDVSVVLESIKTAIKAAYIKDFGRPDDDPEKITVDLDAKTGEAKVIIEGKDVTPYGFGRIAAQTAKQVILQRIREEEKNAVLTDYASRVGSLINGMILRFDGPNVIVDVGRSQGIMPPSEQIRIEQYHVNQRLTFLLKEIREGYRGSEIILSRADPQLVAALFTREVPELASGSVEIKSIVREAGGRTKIAVYSSQSGVDPVGSCVGQKGVRVQAVINELGQEEKIDVLAWTDDMVQLITSALSPAKDLVIKLDKKNKQATVFVPEESLSVAIGRGGQNVRLASKLTGYILDIREKEEIKKGKKSKDENSKGTKKNEKTTSKENTEQDSSQVATEKPSEE
jgi:N utilization substance protein A